MGNCCSKTRPPADGQSSPYVPVCIPLTPSLKDADKRSTLETAINQVIVDGKSLTSREDRAEFRIPSVPTTPGHAIRASNRTSDESLNDPPSSTNGGIENNTGETSAETFSANTRPIIQVREQPLWGGCCLYGQETVSCPGEMPSFSIPERPSVSMSGSSLQPLSRVSSDFTDVDEIIDTDISSERKMMMLRNKSSLLVAQVIKNAQVQEKFRRKRKADKEDMILVNRAKVLVSRVIHNARNEVKREHREHEKRMRNISEGARQAMFLQNRAIVVVSRAIYSAQQRVKYEQRRERSRQEEVLVNKEKPLVAHVESAAMVENERTSNPEVLEGGEESLSSASSGQLSVPESLPDLTDLSSHENIPDGPNMSNTPPNKKSKMDDGKDREIIPSCNDDPIEYQISKARVPAETESKRSDDNESSSSATDNDWVSESSLTMVSTEVTTTSEETIKTADSTGNSRSKSEASSSEKSEKKQASSSTSSVLAQVESSEDSRTAVDEWSIGMTLDNDNDKVQASDHETQASSSISSVLERVESSEDSRTAVDEWSIDMTLDNDHDVVQAGDYETQESSTISSVLARVESSEDSRTGVDEWSIDMTLDNDNDEVQAGDHETQIKFSMSKLVAQEGTHKNPSTSADKYPSTSADKHPSTSVDTQPSTSADEWSIDTQFDDNVLPQTLDTLELFGIKSDEERQQAISKVMTHINIQRQRARLSPAGTSTAVKYLLARKFDPDRAIILYNTHVAQRALYKLDTISPYDKQVQKELTSGKFTIMPNSSETEPTIAIATVSRHDPAVTSPQGAIQGLVFQLDEAIKSPITQRNGLVLIVDMSHAAFRNIDMDLWRRVLELIQSSYPARLNKVLVVSPPLLLHATLRVLLAFVSKKTRRKVAFVNQNELPKHLSIRSIPISLGGLAQIHHREWVRQCIRAYDEKNVAMTTSDSSSGSDTPLIFSKI